MDLILIIVDQWKGKVLWRTLNSSDYRALPYYYVCSYKKPLVPYIPNSFRSRLLEPSIVMPGPNINQIVLGDML